MHGHSHSGAHGHSHGESLLAADHLSDVQKPESAKAQPNMAKWKLTVAMVLCFGFMIAEVVGGYLAGSLAIMTDAAHLLSDVASFLISLFAIWLAERPASAKATFGYHRVEVFGALASVVMIWFLTGILCYEAIQRVIHPEPVDGKIMFITATAGLLVNLMMMKILHQGHGHGHSHGGHSHGSHSHGGGGVNINVHAAFIHVLGDLVQSVGVMIAAAIIWAIPSAHIADPICTFLFSILVLFTTVGILRTGFVQLLNSVPEGINLGKLAHELAGISGVSNVHDLHVWSYGTDRVSMTVHIVADNQSDALEAAQEIAAKYGIKHSTVQVEQCGSNDINVCVTHNQHVDGCALSLTEEFGSPRIIEVVRPLDGKVHLASDGSSHPISTTPRPVKLVQVVSDAGECGSHGHSHGSHGHSHGHTAGAAPQEPAAPAEAAKTSSGGHSHSHSHGHGHSHGSHGHSHA